MDVLKNLFRYRRYIVENAWNELRFRYAGTTLGFFWNVINPLIEVLIYSLVFSQLFTLRSGSSGSNDYVLYLISGLFPWISFSGSIMEGSNTLIKNRSYLRRLALPPEIFIAVNFITSILSLHIYFVWLVLYKLIIHRGLGLEIILLPVLGIMLHLLSFGFTLIVANVQVLIPDIREILRAFVHIWRWTMPIIYTASIFPENAQFLFDLNPPYVFIQSIRGILVDQSLPAANEWLRMSLWGIIFILVGFAVSTKLASDVKDEL